MLMVVFRTSSPAFLDGIQSSLDVGCLFSGSLEVQTLLRPIHGLKYSSVFFYPGVFIALAVFGIIVTIKNEATVNQTLSRLCWSIKICVLNSINSGKISDTTD